LAARTAAAAGDEVATFGAVAGAFAFVDNDVLPSVAAFASSALRNDADAAAHAANLSA
jgi:hypothetical protein